ncbi:Hin recombinase [Salmonella enterica]|nr:Hin recombinase [Salmonella enterica]ECE6691196.1 Hin recombinase [Salmonella enterica subsp. diarizonae]ECG8577913.1 Hin recombinase [Salmonella enterica subsp. diarizonae]EDL6700709.1 Hin recombinase [Salmonella enterica]EDQ8488384.1 Hin recombinase [Salmonella enterica]
MRDWLINNTPDNPLRRPKLTPGQWEQAGRLLAAGETRHRVGLLFDVSISTLYKKFPVNQSR